MVALFNNAARMRPGQIWARQTQNLTATNRDVFTWLSLGFAFTRFGYLTDFKETYKCKSCIFTIHYYLREILPSDRPITISTHSTNKLSSLKMTKWHAHVAHMPKHMNMVGPIWRGAMDPLGPPLNPALQSAVTLKKIQLGFGSPRRDPFFECLRPCLGCNPQFVKHWSKTRLRVPNNFYPVKCCG